MKKTRTHKLKKEKSKTVMIIVYAFVLAIAILSTLSVIFPALFGYLVLELETEIDPFELGIWAIPVIIANLVVFIFGFLYYKKVLPNFVRNGLQFLVNFDISAKITVITLVAILGIYIGFTVEELFLNEQDQWADYVRIQMVLEGWPFSDSGEAPAKILYVKNFLLKTSEVLFQNTKIVPFIGTITLLLVTYFFTAQLTKKKFPGIIAVLITLSGFSFLRYDTLASYSNFWTLFFILSLYLMNTKRWIFSPISFFSSVLSKALTAAFLPLTFFFIYNSEMKQKKKIRLAALYIIITMILMGALFYGVEPGGSVNIEGIQTFDFTDFLIGFSAWAYQLRFDYLLLMFYLPLTVGLILVSRSGIRNADSVLVLMAGTLFAAPLLSGFTGFNIFPYRYLPFAIFFAIGVGTLLSRSITGQAAKLHKLY